MPSPKERAANLREYMRNRDAEDIRIDDADEADDLRYIEEQKRAGEPTIPADEVWKELGLAHRIPARNKTRSR
jgi:hypothetical protein